MLRLVIDWSCCADWIYATLDSKSCSISFIVLGVLGAVVESVELARFGVREQPAESPTDRTSKSDNNRHTKTAVFLLKARHPLCNRIRQ